MALGSQRQNLEARVTIAIAYTASDSSSQEDREVLTEFIMKGNQEGLGHREESPRFYTAIAMQD